jgi:hydrogenase maturation factor
VTHAPPAAPAAPACITDHDGHCITCSDQALPMTVVALDDERELALCEAEDGSRHTIEIALVAEVRPADCLLVHAGTAIQRVRQAAC